MAAVSLQAGYDIYPLGAVQGPEPTLPDSGVLLLVIPYLTLATTTVYQRYLLRMFEGVGIELQTWHDAILASLFYVLRALVLPAVNYYRGSEVSLVLR
jgi:hypothetical protein